MCGFVCVYNPSGGNTSPATLRSMTDALTHRGPDDYGYAFAGRGRTEVWRDTDPAPFNGAGVAMGHRRLSILDLSHAGRQPFCSPDKRYWMVYNGELYNYLELRDDLVRLGYSFSTTTDTEVVLTAFREWGNRCLDRFIGMWALVIWDNKTETLFVSRDRFGIKPLFYTKAGNSWLFASEIKALLKHDAVKSIPDEGQLFRYLWSEDNPENGATFFSGVYSVQPAHILNIREGQCTEQSYWQLPEYDIESDRRSFKEKADQFLELLTDSVRIQLRSDVPVGTMLSGGLDSTSIAATINAILRSSDHGHESVKNRHQAISCCYPGMWNDETQKIDELAELLNIEVIKLFPSTADVQDRFESVIDAVEEPFSGTMPFVQDLMMAQAKASGLTVTLNGHGPDEMFAGYPARHCSFVAADYLGHGKLLKGTREVRGMRKLHNVEYSDLIYAFLRIYLPAFGRIARATHRIREKKFFREEAFRDFGSTPARFRESSTFGKSALDRRLRREFFAEVLPKCLTYEDRASMASSVESRVPFLDHRLVEFAFGLDDSDKINNGMTKYVIREAMKDMLPKSISSDPRKLFIESSFASWLQGPLRPLVEGTLLSEHSRVKGIVDPKHFLPLVKKVIEGHSVSEWSLNLVWRTLTAEMWLRRFS